MKVPTTATGMATMGISMARKLFRNSSTVRITRPRAMRKVLRTSRIDSSMKIAES